MQKWMASSVSYFHNVCARRGIHGNAAVDNRNNDDDDDEAWSFMMMPTVRKATNKRTK